MSRDRIYCLNEYVYVIFEDERIIIGSNRPVVLRIYAHPENILIHIHRKEQYMKLPNAMMYKAVVLEYQFWGPAATRRYNIIKEHVERMINHGQV